MARYKQVNLLKLVLKCYIKVGVLNAQRKHQLSGVKLFTGTKHRADYKT